EMVLQAFQRSNAFFEQQFRPGSFKVAPQRVDRQIFLVLKMIEKGTFGHAGSLGDVLNRTPVESEGMQGIYCAARELFAQTRSSHANALPRRIFLCKITNT